VCQLQSQYDDGTETRRQLLAACEAMQSPEGEISLDALLEVWRGVVRRIYHYYQLSASSYFKFLKLNGGVRRDLTSADLSLQFLEQPYLENQNEIFSFELEIQSNSP